MNLLSRLRCIAAVALLAWAPVMAAIVVPVDVDLSALLADGRLDPARDQVALRGSHPPLSWQQPIVLKAAGGGRYTGTLRFDGAPPGGQAVAYKIRVERAGQGPGEGWESGPNRRLRLDAPSPRIGRAFDDPPDPATLSRAGTIERLGMVASAHVAPRAVQVWLPPGYAQEPARRYPVLYLHDGQNMFDEAAAGAEWQVDETAQRLVEAGVIRPLIVVAVDSGPQRIIDYTPTPDPGRREGGGLAAYARFLIDELKPQIDRRYRTKPGRAHTAVGGSSLGGVASLALALQHGEVVGSALVASPSLWWDAGWVYRAVADWSAAAPRPRLWLDMGGREGEGVLPAARRLRDVLVQRGWTDATLRYTEAPEAGHDEAAWAARVDGMLRFLDPWPDGP